MLMTTNMFVSATGCSGRGTLLTLDGSEHVENLIRFLHPQGESNPCWQNENLLSLPLDDGDVKGKSQGVTFIQITHGTCYIIRKSNSP
jgi:hypothetical protein